MELLLHAFCLKHDTSYMFIYVDICSTILLGLPEVKVQFNGLYKFPEQGLLSECPCVNIDVTHLTTNSPWKIHHGQQQTFIELAPGPRRLVSHSKKWVNTVK